MILRNSDNSDYFELVIERYQFADDTKLSCDDLEWLFISIKASLSGRTWESTDPSLMYREAKRLAEWFHQVAIDHCKDTKIQFVEPNISFELVHRHADQSTIRVYFELEARPPWRRSYGCGNDWEQVYVELVVDNSDLFQASESILADLASLPPRRNALL